MIILPGHVLEYADSHYTQIGHWDQDGNFLEYIDVHGYTVGVDFLNVYAMTQYRASVYIAAQNYGPVVPTFVIQEYDSNASWVRDVVTGIDGTDPLQNPGGYSQFDLIVNSLWLDSVGNIYGAIPSSTVYIWVWDNAGNFIRTIDLGSHGFPSVPGGAIFVDPLDNTQLIYELSNDNIYVYDIDTNTFTTISPGVSVSQRSDLANSGKFYRRIPPSTVRVYEPGFATSTDYTFSLPASVTVFLVARTGNEDGTVWVTGRNSDPFPSFFMWKLRLSDGAVLVAPITISSGATAGLAIWEHVVYRTPRRRIAQATLIGAN